MRCLSSNGDTPSEESKTQPHELLTLWATPDAKADSRALLAAKRPAPGRYKRGACHAFPLTP